MKWTLLWGEPGPKEQARLRWGSWPTSSRILYPDSYHTLSIIFFTKLVLCFKVSKFRGGICFCTFNTRKNLEGSLLSNIDCSLLFFYIYQNVTIFTKNIKSWNQTTRPEDSLSPGLLHSITNNASRSKRSFSDYHSFLSMKLQKYVRIIPRVNIGQILAN